MQWEQLEFPPVAAAAESEAGDNCAACGWPVEPYLASIAEGLLDSCDWKDGCPQSTSPTTTTR